MPRKTKENIKIEDFLQKLKNVEWGKRYSLTKAIAQIGERAVEPLTQMLKDKNKEVRMKAAWALGYTKGERAVESLSQALKDENLDVRNEAEWSLKKLGKTPSKLMLKEMVLITGIEKINEDPPLLKSSGVGSRLYSHLLDYSSGHCYTNMFPEYGHRLLKLVYDNVKRIYKEQETYESGDANALTIFEDSIYVATSKGILHLDTNLKEVNEFYFDTLLEEMHHLLRSDKKRFLGPWTVLIDSLASSDKAIFVSTYGNFIAFDKNFNKLSSVQLYDAQDILIYKNTAYLLDDIVFPLYIYRVDIENPENLKITERISIKGPNQHLYDQWINPELNQWLVVQGCNTRGGGYQEVFIYSLSGINKEWYLFRWDNVPGNENHRLIRYLRDELHIYWVEDAELIKLNDNRTIRIFTSTESIEIILEDNKHALIKIDEYDTYSLQVIEENGKFDIHRACTSQVVWFPSSQIIKNEGNLFYSVLEFEKKWETGNKDNLLVDAVIQFSRAWALLRKGELLIDAVTKFSPAWAVVRFEGIRCLAKIDTTNNKVQFSNFLDLELSEKKWSEKVIIKQSEKILYIIAGKSLRIIDIKKEPKIILTHELDEPVVDFELMENMSKEKTVSENPEG